MAHGGHDSEFEDFHGAVPLYRQPVQDTNTPPAPSPMPTGQATDACGSCLSMRSNRSEQQDRRRRNAAESLAESSECGDCQEEESLVLDHRRYAHATENGAAASASLPELNHRQEVGALENRPAGTSVPELNHRQEAGALDSRPAGTSVPELNHGQDAGALDSRPAGISAPELNHSQEEGALDSRPAGTSVPELNHGQEAGALDSRPAGISVPELNHSQEAEAFDNRPAGISVPELNHRQEEGALDDRSAAPLSELDHRQRVDALNIRSAGTLVPELNHGQDVLDNGSAAELGHGQEANNTENTTAAASTGLGHRLDGNDEENGTTSSSARLDNETKRQDQSSSNLCTAVFSTNSFTQEADRQDDEGIVADETQVQQEANEIRSQGRRRSRLRQLLSALLRCFRPSTTNDETTGSGRSMVGRRQRNDPSFSCSSGYSSMSHIHSKFSLTGAAAAVPAVTTATAPTTMMSHRCNDEPAANSSPEPHLSTAV